MYCIPSRSRPNRLAEFAASFGADDLKLPVCVVLSADDPFVDRYFEKKWPDTWGFIVSPNSPGSCGDALNFFFSSFPTEKYYGLLSDDILLDTPNTLRMLAEAAGDWGVTVADEGHHHDSLYCYTVMGGKLVRAIGWWAFPGLKHNCIDSVIDDIARTLRLNRYMPEVRFVAKHPAYGNAPGDDTYTRAEEFNKGASDIYGQQWHGKEREPTLARIKAAMEADNGKSS